jgi:hypothetical protein
MKISIKKIKEIMNEEMDSLLRKENKTFKASKEFADKFLECFDINSSRNKFLYEKVYKSLHENEKLLESLSGRSSLTDQLLKQAPPRALCVEYFKKIMQEEFESTPGDEIGHVKILRDSVEGYIRHLHFIIVGQDLSEQIFSCWYVSVDNDEFYFNKGTDVYFAKAKEGNMTIDPEDEDQKVEGIRIYGEW